MSNKNSNNTNDNNNNKDRGRNARSNRSKGNNNQRLKDSGYNSGKGSNDVSWYATDPQLLRDAASIPYSWAIGTPLNLNNPLLETLSNKGAIVIPGVMALRTIPAFSRSVDATSPLNIASNATYAFIRHANSGHSNYDAPDLMIYIMAMSQVYSYITFLQRVYGLATLYAQRNRYLPREILHVCGVDPDSVANNLASFRYGINLLINKAASFAVPSTMPYFQRQAFLYSQIYTEGASIKDQLYLYVPDGFYKYTLNTDLSGMLEYVVFNDDTYRTVDQLLDFGNALLMPLIYSEDMNIMSGDILKAYGQNNIIQLQSLPEVYPIVPVYNQEVLEQMKNATVVGAVQSMNLVQDSTHGYLLYGPQAITGATEPATDWKGTANRMKVRSLLEDRVISTSLAAPTAENSMVLTRLTVAADNLQTDYKGQGYDVVDLYPGSEMVHEVELITMEASASGTVQPSRYFYEYAEMWLAESADVNDQVTTLRRWAALANFKYHPAVHVIACKAGSVSPAISVADARLFFDVDNYTLLSRQDVKRLNEAAVMNQLHVPSIAKL